MANVYKSTDRSDELKNILVAKSVDVFQVKLIESFDKWLNQYLYDSDTADQPFDIYIFASKVIDRVNQTVEIYDKFTREIYSKSYPEIVNTDKADNLKDTDSQN